MTIAPSRASISSNLGMTMISLDMVSKDRRSVWPSNAITPSSMSGRIVIQVVKLVCKALGSKRENTGQASHGAVRHARTARSIAARQLLLPVESNKCQPCTPEFTAHNTRGKYRPVGRSISSPVADPDSLKIDRKRGYRAVFGCIIMEILQIRGFHIFNSKQCPLVSRLFSQLPCWVNACPIEAIYI